MRVARLHGERDLRIDELDDPDLRATDIRVDIAYTGICGSDLHEYRHGPAPIRAEETDHALPEADVVELLPKPMGHEIAGTVSDTGNDVSGISIGDQVTLNLMVPCQHCRYCHEGEYNLCEAMSGRAVESPGFADQIVVPASTAVQIPDTVSLRSAALTEPLSVSLHGLRRSGFTVGDTIAVIGAGPIGLGVTAIAAAAGALQIIVSEPNETRRRAARDAGADVVVNPEHTDVKTAVMDAANGRVDVGVEAAGVSETLTQALRCTKYGGTTVLLSVFDEVTELHPNDIMQAERKLVGSFGFEGGPRAYRGEYPAVLELLAEGDLDPEVYISDEWPLDDIEAAFETLLNDDSTHVKILVTPEP